MAHAAARVIIIPEAESDDGAGVARVSASLADAIVLCGRDQQRLGALAAELQDSTAVRVSVFCGDPREDADRAALQEMIDELFGRS